MASSSQVASRYLITGEHMGYKFVGVDKLLDESPSQRTSKPAADATFTWWWLAVPEPAYRLCVVQVKSLTGAKLTCIPLDADGHPMQELSIDLDDWNQAWRGQPSTVERPAGANAVGMYGLVCIAEKVLKASGWTDDLLLPFAKYPRGEDLQIESQKLKDFIRSIYTSHHGHLPSLPVEIKKILDAGSQ
jgi:hypothetical protein